MEYLEIRRLLLTIFIIVPAWSIAWTQMCGQTNGKWYCLYLGQVTWADAQTACINRRARLAWDNSSTSNDALNELIRNAEVSQAWIGGKTGPLYFNWMNKDLDPDGVYYQGCYKSGSELMSQCKFKWSISQCKLHCHRFKYFSHHKERGARMCCCGDRFGMMDGGLQGSCSVCDKNMPCGADSTHKAIYMTSAQLPDNHIWKTFHPVGLTDNQADALCMAVVYNDTSSSVWIEDKNCTEYHYPLCILNEMSQGMGCQSNESNMYYSGKCLAYIRGGVTWETAGDQCRNLSPKRDSVLASFASYFYFVDLEGVIRNIVVASGRQVFWTFGSSRRWVWEDKDTHMRQDIENKRWDKDDDKLPQKDHCILLNENENWASTPCDVESAGFICESDEKPTFSTTIVHTTSSKTETTERPTDTTQEEQKTHSVPHRSIHITSHRPLESSTSSFTTEYSGPGSEPQSADHTIPVVAAVGSVVGLIILTAAVVFLMCWRKRRRMTNKGSGSGKVNVGFSSTTGVDLHNRSKNEYNEEDQGDYTTIAETGNRADATENISCTGEHVYESAQCSDLPNVVKDHIQTTSPNGIAINGPDRRVRGSMENTNVNPNLNPVTEAPEDVSVLYSVPKKERKNRSEIKTQPESNPVRTKRADEHIEKRQPNSSQTSDQSTECEEAVVYAVPKKPSKRSDVTVDGNTPDSVYAYAAGGFLEENVNENTDNADYYNLVVSQNQQRYKDGNPSNCVEEDECATTLVDNDIYNT